MHKSFCHYGNLQTEGCIIKDALVVSVFCQEGNRHQNITRQQRSLPSSDGAFGKSGLLVFVGIRLRRDA